MPLPTAFQNYVTELFLKSPSAKSGGTGYVYALLMHKLREARSLDSITKDSWRKIPGYESTPENAPNQPHPKGWSRSNLARFAPTKRDLATVRGSVGNGSNIIPFPRQK